MYFILISAGHFKHYSLACYQVHILVFFRIMILEISPDGLVLSIWKDLACELY